MEHPVGHWFQANISNCDKIKLPSSAATATGFAGQSSCKTGGCSIGYQPAWNKTKIKSMLYLSICLNSYLAYFYIMDNNTCIRQFADYEQIKNCKAKLKTAQKSFGNLSNVLSLAGNEVRLKIIYLLETEKELCPCDLSDILVMSIPAVSQHLRKLKDGNIVETRKEGQTIYYTLTQENIKILKPFFKHINVQTQKLETV